MLALVTLVCVVLVHIDQAVPYVGVVHMCTHQTRLFQNARKQKWVEEQLPIHLKRFEDFATPTGFIAGKQVGHGKPSAIIAGKQVSHGKQSAFIAGKQVSHGTLSAFITGKQVSHCTPSGFVTDLS